MSTAVLLGLMLAFEPKEPNLMRRKPRDPQQPILTAALDVSDFSGRHTFFDRRVWPVRMGIIARRILSLRTDCGSQCICIRRVVLFIQLPLSSLFNVSRRGIFKFMGDFWSE